MDTRMFGSRFGFGRRAFVARALGALVLAAVALPALTPDAGAAGCGACNDDGDGLTNYEEYAIYGTDPGNPDSDFDGLTDGNEVFAHRTNPLSADTDWDGRLDGNEIASGTNPLVANYAQAPDGGDDADGDGLGGHEEAYIYMTDPLRFDTDGDGLSDGTEVHLGLNPHTFYSK